MEADTDYLRYGKKSYLKHREVRLAKMRERYFKNRSVHTANTRKSRLQRLYGITTEAYDQLLLKQSGACAICKTTADKALDVDHCHKTGVVRGLLCNSCNRALGYFKDSPELLEKAIEYLITGKGGVCGS